MKHNVIRISFIVYLLVTQITLYCYGQSNKFWGELKPGAYNVGYKVIKQQDKLRNNRPLVISIWYPAKNVKLPVIFKEYLFSGIINPSFSNPTPEEKTKILKEFKEILEMPHILGLREIPVLQFEAIMNVPMAAEKNAREVTGKFPGIIMSSEPESLAITAEYLASHGFVVAAVHAPYNQVQPPDSLVWDASTKDLAWLAEYTKQIEIIDQDKIAALGFGGGILPAFLLTMKTINLKAMVNLEGAVFQPFSLTTKSVDYHPEKMKTPMLHIVTTGTKREESEQEIKALNTSLYRVLVENGQVTHQDFSIFGRVANKGLALRNHIAPGG